MSIKCVITFTLSSLFCDHWSSYLLWARPAEPGSPVSTCEAASQGEMEDNFTTFPHWNITKPHTFPLNYYSALLCPAAVITLSPLHVIGKQTNYICIGVWTNTPIVCVYFTYWISYTLTFPLPLLKTAKKSCLFPVLSLGVSLTPVVLVIVSLLLTFSSSSLKPRA